MPGKKKVHNDIMKRQFTGKAPTLKKMARYQALSHKEDRAVAQMGDASNQVNTARREAVLEGSDLHGKMEAAYGKDLHARDRENSARLARYNDGLKLQAELGGRYVQQFETEDEAYDEWGDPVDPQLYKSFAWDDYVIKDVENVGF